MRTIILLCFSALLLSAQNSAIQGVLTDSSGAVITGAKVTITNLETQVARTVVSNESGLYAVPLLSAGQYQVEVSASGFAPVSRPDLRLEVGQTARVDFELKVGAIAESVTIAASAALLQTETTDVGQVIDNKRILEMPLNGRNYLQLAQFTVGVLPGRQLGRGARSGEDGNFISMGMSAAQNNVLLDGNDNSSRTSGGPLGWEAQAVKPPVDAVAEFKVVTNNTAAEYGYRSGAKVLVTTKSGTNEFHGSLYEFLRNDKFDGTNFFANRAGASKPPYRQNQFGGTFGGPVIKNRTFFFGSYQGTRIRLGRSYVSTLPSQEARNGNFANQPMQIRNIFDPLTLTGTGANARRQPFPGNVIPPNRWDPVSKRVIDLYPSPNITGRENLPDNYFFSPSDSNDADQYDMRVDHNISDNHRIFGRYSIRNQFRNEPGTLPFPAMGGQGQTVRLDGDNVVMNLSSTLGATKFNELRFGWSQLNTAFDIPFTENLNAELGIKGVPGDSFGDGLDQGFTLFIPTNYAQMGPRGFWPNINNLHNLLVADSFVIQTGRHGIKFGGEFRRTNIYREAMRHRRGRFNFNGQYTAEFPNVGTSRSNTGNGLADMLLGLASGGQMGNAQGENAIVPYSGFFFQDDWRVTNRLTLNMGLRWELFQKPYFPNPERQTVGRFLTTEANGVPRDQERLVFPIDGRDCGCKNDFNNFAPRLGLAYQLTRSTVIRSGAGLFYGEPNSLTNEFTNFAAGPPNHIEITFAPPRETTDLVVQQGFPEYVTGFVPPNVSLDTRYDSQPTMYVGQWFFDLQHSLPGDILLTLGYNGTKTTHAAYSRNINGPETPSATVQAAQRRVRPQYNAVSLIVFGANANYNALTVKAEKRFSQGLTFLNSFTWSHTIDQAEENLLELGSGRATDYDLSRERANSTLDRRLSFVNSTIYELPFGKGKRWGQSGPASWIFGNWQVGGVVSLLSGTPTDHTISADNQNLGGRVRGDYVRNPNLPSSERTIDRWFDTDFVIPSAPGVISNAGRNLIYGPGVINVDLSVSRRFILPWEGHHVQFRAEAFNAANHANFGMPNTAVGTANAGRIDQADEPRRIQFALKYVF
jgi:hypothetical protein